MTRTGHGQSGSLVDRAVRAVNHHIQSQGLRVGDTLPGEAHFARELEVSRGVMREAFGSLAALGLLDVANGRRPRVGAMDGGAIATSLDHAVNTEQVTVAEVWDVRRTIELRTVALAAHSRTGLEAKAIVDLAEAMADGSGDLALITRRDIAFHQAIARAGRNALFVQIVSSFGPLMEVAVPAAWRTRANEAERRVMIERHRAVAQAIAEGDEAAAVAAMEAHFDDAVGDMLRTTASPHLRPIAPSDH